MESKELENKIKYYAQKYYEGNPEVSDEVFDGLVSELRELNPDSEVLNKTGWGFEPESLEGEKVSHRYGLVGSLTKTREASGINKELRNNKCLLSKKLDGLSMVVYYENGKLVQAVTRGNGEIGIDKTEKVKRIWNNELNEVGFNFTGAVRGEILISKNNWKEIKSKNEDATSPRNFAAGIINRNEIDEDIKYLDLVLYKIIGYENMPSSIEKDAESMHAVLERIFGTDRRRVLSKSECNFSKINDDSLERWLEDVYQDYKDNYEYEIDGLVLSGNEIIYDGKSIEYKEQAYKFATETAEVKVEKIDWNLTRLGKLIPTVEIEPVELSGATIKRASGFNARYIKDNHIDTGAIIEIMRSGEVIPDIQCVVSEAPIYNLPNKCPVCNGDLEWKGVDLVCNNDNCKNKTYSNLMVWSDIIGKVDGLGRNLKEAFFEECEIESLEDFYNKPLFYNNSTATGKKIEKFVDKMIFDNVDAIDALCALNIPRLGRSSAEKLVQNKDIYEKFIKYSITREIDQSTIESINNIVGPATAKQILDVDRLESLKYVVDRLIYPTIEDKSRNKKIAVTGSLEGVSRKEFENIIAEKGYSLTSNLKEAEYLVTNNPDPTSSKGKKAKELNVPIITQNEFMKIINK